MCSLPVETFKQKLDDCLQCWRNPCITQDLQDLFQLQKSKTNKWTNKKSHIEDEYEIWVELEE